MHICNLTITYFLRFYVSPDGKVGVGGRCFRAIVPGNVFKRSKTDQPAPMLFIGVYAYSHSMVPGGLLVMSKTQRFTPFTSLIMRLASFSRISYGSFTQSAVIPSCDSTARMAMV